MDFLEGFFLGPIWSDTDYENRPHRGLYFLLALAIAGLYAFLQIRPQHQAEILMITYLPGLVGLIALILATPFLACFYYRLRLPFRILILLTLAFKYLLAVSTLLHLTLPLYRLDLPGLLAQMPDFINDRVSRATDFFRSLGDLLGTLFGLIGGGLWIVGQVLLVFVILIAVPLLVLVAMRLVQMLLDELVSRFLYREEF